MPCKWSSGTAVNVGTPAADLSSWYIEGKECWFLWELDCGNLTLTSKASNKFAATCSHTWKFSITNLYKGFLHKRKVVPTLHSFERLESVIFFILRLCLLSSLDKVKCSKHMGIYIFCTIYPKVVSFYASVILFRIWKVPNNMLKMWQV